MNDTFSLNSPFLTLSTNEYLHAIKINLLRVNIGSWAPCKGVFKAPFLAHKADVLFLFLAPSYVVEIVWAFGDTFVTLYKEKYDRRIINIIEKQVKCI